MVATLKMSYENPQPLWYFWFKTQFNYIVLLWILIQIFSDPRSSSWVKLIIYKLLLMVDPLTVYYSLGPNSLEVEFILKVIKAVQLFEIQWFPYSAFPNLSTNPAYLQPAFYDMLS